MKNKYLFDDKEYMDIDLLISEIDNNIVIGDSYDIMLDECYESINICGYDYEPSVALQRVDSCVYNCGRNNYISDILADIRYNIESLSSGETYSYCNIKIKCI